MSIESSLDIGILGKEERKNINKLQNSWDENEDNSEQIKNRFKNGISRKSTQQKLIKKAPRIQMNKLEKMDTLRVEKIQEIISDEFPVRGVTIFDLHLLNMTK